MNDRDDHCVRHSVHRAQRVNTHAAVSLPISVYISREQRPYDDQIETGRWTHIGTSPRLTSFDVAQARRRFQTFMADS